MAFHPHESMTFKNALAHALAITFLTTAAHAAAVTWGAATGISGDTDVSTNGTLVSAFNIGGSGVPDTTVNGVLFKGLALAGTNVTSGNFNLTTANAFGGASSAGSSSPPFRSLSAPYRVLLGNGGGAFTDPFTLTISGLVLSKIYEFQFWSNISVAGFANASLTATSGNAVTLDSTNPDGEGMLGQFAIGTFVANNASQQIVLTGTVLESFNAFQLRDLGTPVPEPGTAALFGLALPALLGFRRRSK